RLIDRGEDAFHHLHVRPLLLDRRGLHDRAQHRTNILIGRGSALPSKVGEHASQNLTESQRDETHWPTTTTKFSSRSNWLERRTSTCASMAFVEPLMVVVTLRTAFTRGSCSRV